MKVARVLARIVLISVAVALFMWLTQVYAGTVRPPRFMGRYGQLRRNDRPPQPQLGRFPSFLGEGIVLALIAVAGRMVFRLRLTDAPRNKDEIILLDLGSE